MYGHNVRLHQCVLRSIWQSNQCSCCLMQNLSFCAFSYANMFSVCSLNCLSLFWCTVFLVLKVCVSFLRCLFLSRRYVFSDISSCWRVYNGGCCKPLADSEHGWRRKLAHPVPNNFLQQAHNAAAVCMSSLDHLTHFPLAHFLHCTQCTEPMCKV